jgi:UDP-glucose 4-epimerase
MRILVTGSSGFIGTNLCEGLVGSHDLIGMDRRAPQRRVEKVVYDVVELQQPEHVLEKVRAVDPEVIIHLAAQARVEPSFADPIATYGDNVLATINLLRAGLRQGGRLRKFVYASSETVYGPSTTYPTAEDARLDPQSPYAASKAASEFLVHSAFEGRAVILRSGMSYGPYSDPHAHVVARFIEQALKGDSLLFPAHLAIADHPTRDVNYVSNFVDGVRLAIEADAAGTFNIASGKELSILDLAKAVVSRVGSGRVELSPTYRYQQGEEGLRTCLDISKAREAFGYAPRIDLAEGLDRTIRWMRSLTPPPGEVRSSY